MSDQLKPTMFETANKLQRIIDWENADELKPCPSCGKVQNVVTRSDGCIVWCVICRVQMPINLWNRRPIEAALTAQLAEKDEEIKALKEVVGVGATLEGFKTEALEMSNYAKECMEKKEASDKRIEELKGALSRLLETHTFYTEHDKIAIDEIKAALKGGK